MTSSLRDQRAEPSAPAVIDHRLGAFAEHIGLTLVEMSASRVVATWTAAERHHQPHSIVHGGVHCSVVETLGSIGAAVWLGDKGRCVGASNTTDFLRPVSEGPMTSVATPIHRGRSQQLWAVETRDESDRLVARGQVRVHNLVSQRADSTEVARPLSC